VSILSELRVAIRHHAQRPAFALSVLVTLALTIGATTAVFAVVEAMLVRGLPFARPDRLMWVASVRADNPLAPFTLPEYLDYRARTRSLSGLAALANWSGSMAGDGAAERLTGARMSANAFTVLGVTAVAGRLLTESDDRPDAAPVVVLSYRVATALWWLGLGDRSIDANQRRVIRHRRRAAGAVPDAGAGPRSRHGPQA
jgi:hypothetical protein